MKMNKFLRKERQLTNAKIMSRFCRYKAYLMSKKNKW